MALEAHRSRSDGLRAPVEGLGLDLPPMMQNPAELGALINLVEQNLGRHPRSVLEIGTWQGGTIARFRRRWPGAAVIAVDPVLPAPIEGVHFVQGPSQDETVREQVQELWPEPFDFVHVDGDHHLEPAEQDFSWAVGPLKARMVALHDVAEWQNPLIEVWKLWHEIRLAGWPAVEIRYDPGGVYGYGVVLAHG